MSRTGELFQIRSRPAQHRSCVLWLFYFIAFSNVFGQPTLSITEFSRVTGARLNLAGIPGHQIALESTTNFVEWTVEGVHVLSGVGAAEASDAAARLLSARFYRAKDLDQAGTTSTNIVGFVTRDVPPGNVLIGNPFLRSNNRISVLLPDVPNGVSFFKVLPSGEPTVNNFAFGWSDSLMTLLPGEGLLVQNPSESFELTFLGEVVPGAARNHLEGREVFCSSILPHAGFVDGPIALTNNSLLAVHRLLADGYVGYAFEAASGSWNPETPQVDFGEAVLAETETNIVWEQAALHQPLVSVYSVTNHAVSSTGPRINFVTYNVSNAFGRVFHTNNVTPLGEQFLGQVYAGTNASEENFTAVGNPVNFLPGAGAGYLRSGLVPLSNLASDSFVYLQLRVWDGAAAATYESAEATGASSGKSAVFSAIARTGFSEPPSAANGFPSFSLSGAPLIEVRVNGQVFSANEAAVPRPAYVEIHTAFPGGFVFYTLDGSSPTRGAFYAGAFPGEPALIRAVAYTADFSQSVESVPFRLRILEPPVVLRAPTDFLVAANGTARFDVRASGSDLHYQWRFNGGNLPLATNLVLELPNAQTSQAGSYDVVVTNQLGAVTSAVATLTVWLAPAVSVAPPLTNVSVGADVTFSANASGTAPLFFQWRKNGVNIPGATNATLALANVQLIDGGSYAVVVMNEVGATTSDSALLLIDVLSQAPPSDNFAQRQTLVVASGFASGTNLLATRESLEPRHAGKFGSNSVWYTWRAPANGIATFRTIGSTFDTLLGIYRGTNLGSLETVASDEDRAGFLTSEVRFNAAANTDYQIAVDGFVGQQGVFKLSWNLEVTGNSLPLVTAVPLSQTVTQGASITLSVTATGSGLTYQWLFNEEPLAGATTPNLVIANAQPADVGYYAVAITNNQGRGLITSSAALEMGSEAGPVAQDKLEDWFYGPSEEGPGFRFSPASSFASVPPYLVGAGSIGSHLFSNLTGKTSTNEQNHCGQIINATMWLFLKATDDGTLLVDTRGSAIPTVMAAYVVSLEAGLLPTPLICAVTNGPDRSSCMAGIEAKAGTTYAVVADGVNRTLGRIQLNWTLGRAPEASSSIPNYLVVRAGTDVSLSGGITIGTNRTTYQWWHEGAPIPGATNATLTLASVQQSDAGSYSIFAANEIGSLTHVVAHIELDPVTRVLSQSLFETIADGWTVAGDAANPTLLATGGNPDGCLQAVDLHSGPVWYWVVPPKHLTNLAQAYGGWLEFDLRQSTTSGQTTNLADLILQSPDLSLHFSVVTNPSVAWTSYKVPLQEGRGWRKGALTGPGPSQAEMQSALSNAVSLWIRGEFATVRDIGWLDNFVVAAVNVNNSPVLRSRQVSSGSVLLEWPANALGFQLESTNALRSNPAFSKNLSLTPINERGTNRVTVPATENARFFRLRR